MNKQEILNKIKALDGLDNNEKAYLVNLVNTTKKYGLVWEDKPEDVEEELRTKLPILKEVKELAIINDTATENHPNHILIEGDNLHALTALTFTHEGLIDLIYIDPPYNTGNKDFKYNDTFVDKEDSYRHSKWLSFMNKRLRIAKRLLSENGVVFISIDVNEIAQLKIICDEIFGFDKLVNVVANINNPKGRSDEKNIASAHEYLVCYSKGNINFKGWNAGENILKRYNKVDEAGIIYREIDLRKTGDNDKRKDRPNLFYYFYYNSETKDFYPTINEEIPVGYIQIKPLRTDLSDGNWRWSLETSKNNIDFLIPKLMGVRKKYTIFEKDILSEGQRVKATSVWNNKEVNSERGTEQFIELGFDKKLFPKPKPMGLIKLILELIPFQNLSLLDFFAGSGTTLHATMALNAEDGGNRQCILVTNNENNICEEVTYERNKRVIKGYTNAKGVAVAGLKNNNLRYFKSEFISRNKTIKNKKELTKLATELLCIKEDCYNPVESKAKWYSAFADAKSQLIVIYDDAMLEESIAIIKKLNESKQNNNPIKVYVFSNGQYPYTEDFEEVLDFINLCALPDAIYKAYQNVLPKENKEFIPTLEEDINPEIAI